MKVLLYAVFKDHEGCNLLAIASHVAGERCEVRSLKAERCSTLTPLSPGVVARNIVMRTSLRLQAPNQSKASGAEMVDPLLGEPAHE